MPRSEAQKRADKKYKAKAEATLVVNLKKAEADVFKEICWSRGKTVNAALAEFVRSTIREEGIVLDSYIEDE